MEEKTNNIYICEECWFVWEHEWLSDWTCTRCWNKVLKIDNNYAEHINNKISKLSYIKFRKLLLKLEWSVITLHDWIDITYKKDKMFSWNYKYNFILTYKLNKITWEIYWEDKFVDILYNLYLEIR